VALRYGSQKLIDTRSADAETSTISLRQEIFEPIRGQAV
jgi:hypothetical protein